MMTLPADVASRPGSGSDAEGWRIGCETCERRTLPPADPEMAPMTPLPADRRAEPTHPRSIRLTAAEWSELQRRGVRGTGSLAEWLAQPASSPQAPRSAAG